MTIIEIGLILVGLMQVGMFAFLWTLNSSYKELQSLVVQLIMNEVHMQVMGTTQNTVEFENDMH